VKDSTQKFVVCAAIRRKSDKAIIAGARHYDGIMRATANREGGVREQWLNVDQGFIDNYGNFLTRAEAWDIALAAKQIRGPEPQPGKLHSEDLY
jgi:hypothetical protein